MTAIEKAKDWFAAHGNRFESCTGLTGSVPMSRQTIFLKVDGEYRQVAIQDILFVSGLKDYVKFYLTEGQKPLITHLTMKAVEEMLPSEQFMRVHRSYIVALDKIRKVDRNDCIYIGEEIIRVTDAFRNTFLQYINTRKA